MSGVQFMFDESGERKAVVLDLTQQGELWEDLYDTVIIQSRRGEPPIRWEDAKRDLGLDDESQS